MNKIYKLIIIVLVCNFSNILFSWDSEVAKYFPLNIGNSWTYYHVSYMHDCLPTNSNKYKIQITGDSVFNGHKYYKFSDGSLYRIDSSSMNVYTRNFNADCVYDSLLARIGDNIFTCTAAYFFVDTGSTFFGGALRYTRTTALLDADTRVLMYGVGLYSQGFCLTFTGGATDNLSGCVIDGIVYGDTTVIQPDTSLLSYLPLKVGNVWVYNVSGFGPLFGCEKRVKVRTVGTLTQNSHQYFLFQTNEIIYFPCGGNGSCTPLPFDTLRVDSVNYNIYKYTINSGCTYSPHEIMIDSLKARLNDTVKNYCGSNPPFYYRCIDTNSLNIFGSVRQKREYSNFYFEGGYGRTYVKDIGISGVGNSGTWGMCTTSILGCVIDGIVYGDTSFTNFHTVSGTVRYNDNNQIVTNGYVKALRHSYTGNNDVLDSTRILSNGSYTLIRIPPGDTFDLMAFQDDEVAELDFVPTYYQSTIEWQQAAHLYLNNDTTGMDIGVFRIYNDGLSERKISGGVYGWSEGDSWIGISKARIYARSLDKFRNYDITLNNGGYFIDSLQPGQYQVICNIQGYPTIISNVELGTTDRTDINFYYKYLVGINEEQNLPDEYSLSQNYPNPFNPVTNIKFSIIAPGKVSLKIFDILGKEIITLVNQELDRGNYSVLWDAANYPSGVYFYKIETASFTQTRKMVLLK